MSADYRNPTEVEVNKIISADVRERNRALLAGDLLKAMDITACLAAEKHAKMPCVTLIMDDLVVNDDLLNGQVLNVKAKLSRAFGSSMEVVVEASLEDMFKQERVQICKACFVFIAIAKVGKAKLANLDLVTVEERLEYALAYERRKLRYAARNAAKAKSANKGSASDTCTTRSGDETLGPGEVAMSKTVVESVELVLPSQANHHQTTFGGQIMAWLVSACTISASRLCQTRPSIVEVNGVHFLEKSSVGDRLLFKAMVNKTFDDNTFEVGCRVESSSLEGKTAHINSAYLTFAVFDENKRRKKVPVVKATTSEQARRQGNAVARRNAGIEKEKILGAVGPALSVLWKEKLSNVLSFHNVSAFKKLTRLDKWQEISRENECVLSTCEQDDLTCVKVEATIGKPAVDVFKAVHLETRASWDPIIAQAKVVRKIDDDDSIVHIVMATPPGESTPDKSPTKPSDLLLMESTRPGHVIAHRSVTMKSYPESDQYERKENLSSGFLIRQSETNPNQSTLIYINQVTNQVAAFMSNDLKGGTKVYAERIEKLREYLKV
jgi:acyl-CoA thioesterase 11